MGITTTNGARSLSVPMLVTLIVLSMMGFDAYAASMTGASVPKSMADAAEYGENVYDYAKAKDWKRADATMRPLMEAARKMHAEVAGRNTAQGRVDNTIATLGRAVTAKDQQTAMREANEVTRAVAEMTGAYRPTVPVAVARLDYYGRELEIWAQAQDVSRLQATAVAMRREWDALRPRLNTRGGAQARKFESLVAQVEAAKAPAEYARLAKSVLDEVDNLEKVFHR
jgi:hypothetical protein